MAFVARVSGGKKPNDEPDASGKHGHDQMKKVRGGGGPHGPRSPVRAIPLVVAPALLEEFPVAGPRGYPGVLFVGRDDSVLDHEIVFVPGVMPAVGTDGCHQ